MASHLRYFFSNRLILSIGFVFTCNSFMFGNWVTRIPDVKSALNLTDADLGLALLGAPVGALCIMPLSGWVISRLQLGRTLVVSSLVHMLSLPLLALASGFGTLTLALFFFGISNALMDIAMNASAALIERQQKRPLMATCHGFWSFGAMLGSGAGSLVVGLTPHTFYHLTIVALIAILVLFTLATRLWQIHEARQSGDKVFALPKGALLLLSLMAFCILLSEGGIADWSAIYMRDEVLASPYLIGLAYSGFSLLMAVGRLAGDAIIPKVGKKQVVFAGGIIAVVGLGAALLFHHPAVVIAGFSLAGFGYSCIVPVLFISAANEPGYAPGTGIAAVTTFGYSGFLVGPPFIGFLSEQFTLTIGLGFILFCSFMVSMLAIVIKFR